MRNSKKQPYLSLKALITLSILYNSIPFGCAERKDEIAVTLSDCASDIRLFIGRDQIREPLTVRLTLEPEDTGKRPCPVFDLQARVNGEKVTVSKSGYEIDESGIRRCLYPTFSYPIPQSEIVLTNFFLGESSPLWREVLGHLDIQVSDSSGQYEAVFDRTLPQEVTMSIIKPTHGELQVGEPIEIGFDPAPEQIEQVSIVYQPESSGSPTVEFSREQSDSGDSTRSNVVFILPETDDGNGVLRVGIIPWNRLFIRCDFKACVHETLELFYQNTPLFVSRKVVVSP